MLYKRSTTSCPVNVPLAHNTTANCAFIAWTDGCVSTATYALHANYSESTLSLNAAQQNLENANNIKTSHTGCMVCYQMTVQFSWKECLPGATDTTQHKPQCSAHELCKMLAHARTTKRVHKTRQDTVQL